MNTRSIMLHIRYIFLPEDTCNEYPAPCSSGHPTDLIKAIFWAVVSISASLFLAVLF